MNAQVSIDSLREEATHSVNRLAETIEKALEVISCELTAQELIVKFNQVACNVGILNCVYDDDYEKDFNDLSGCLSIDFIDSEE